VKSRESCPPSSKATLPPPSSSGRWKALRRILINRARDKQCVKRGGGWKRAELDRLVVADSAADEDLLALDEALEHLTQENKPCGDLVKLRFFTGLTLEEAAASLGLGRRTADRYWAYARAWLYEFLTRGKAPEGAGC
jgi:RNA polymerase sigma factor (TIGR02999 family)